MKTQVIMRKLFCIKLFVLLVFIYSCDKKESDVKSENRVNYNSENFLRERMLTVMETHKNLSLNYPKMELVSKKNTDGVSYLFSNENVTSSYSLKLFRYKTAKTSCDSPDSCHDAVIDCWNKGKKALLTLGSCYACVECVNR